MVHVYKCLGRWFVLDVESGSFFETDERTAKLIEKRRSPVADARGDFSDEDMEIQSEINSLISDGVLFTEEPVHPEPVYKGIVKALCLNIAHGCNLRCTYCFAGDGQYHGGVDFMSADTAKNAIDFLVAHSGPRHRLEIDFFGGEPLLNMDAVRATIDYARSIEKESGKEFRFTITTNALALNDELIDYFNKEMYNVVISIDGRKSVHDNVRKDAAGKGSFDRILENARKLISKRGDKSYYVRGTYTAANRDELLAEEYLKRRASGREFGFFHFNIDIYHGPCASKRLVGCNAGDEYLAVAPNGDIYPCHRFDGMPDYVIGNVNTGAFDEKLPRMFNSCNLTKKEECNECWAKYYCSGGCAANSIFFAGGITKPYKIGCELMRKRVECALAIAAIENANKSL